ncbi:hypothetical protein EDI_251830 [Entamoeba dispar SAW760]|uniref:Tyrosine-protein phosphatase domain-containing protein n=1 Tax=Entamoeba dispar (strain ATCC PRA-260 / SAW760) TaxID=370354 RepID=B0E705_ENTDS|nr:uncharacterized protein EDI_251830 [Entamoeba dispar SAW760]EDR29746.1 hypothetical protein EDI_251830 [Entamoeba dispar SAW760]|eukprot:EDR29746.1 hypothetical protein EDI_251830 [Entamoeba dispar SAW760]
MGNNQSVYYPILNEKNQVIKIEDYILLANINDVMNSKFYKTYNIGTIISCGYQKIEYLPVHVNYTHLNADCSSVVIFEKYINIISNFIKDNKRNEKSVVIVSTDKSFHISSLILGYFMKEYEYSFETALNSLESKGFFVQLTEKTTSFLKQLQTIWISSKDQLEPCLMNGLSYQEGAKRFSPVYMNRMC